MEWISVKEDLPLLNTDVLVFDKSNKIFIAYRKSLYGIWHWVDADGEESDVLYWMPLPEPPKEG